MVILFAKAPIPGRVKTRLTPPLGADRAAALYQSLVTDLLCRLTLHFNVELHTDIETDAWRELQVPRRLQVQGDLGERMLAALQGRHAAIVGGDIPDLPVDHVETLLASTADVTLGPAEDGGYWGIAVRRTHPDMFRGVAWSTPSALVQTAAACCRAGLTVAMGPLWHDLDTPEDLARRNDALNH